MLDKILEVLTEGIFFKTKVESSICVRTIPAAGDYAAEDVISDNATAGTPFEFRNVGKSGAITKAIVFCSVTALTPEVALYLYNKKPTGILEDNVANTNVVVADFPAYVGRIDFPAMEDLGGVSESVATASTVGNLELPYSSPDRILYGVAVLRDAVTGESAGMRLGFKIQVRKD